jgi:hypothetical protein
MDEVRFKRREGEVPAPSKSKPDRTPNAARWRAPRREPARPFTPSRRAINLTLFAVAAAQVILVWFTMRGIGMSWDEGFYFDRNAEGAIWLADWLRGNLPDDTRHDPFWKTTPEYLAVPRLVHGISGWLFEGTWLTRGQFLPDLVAQRLLNGVAHGLNCWLIARLILAIAGLGPALAGMLAYASMPRIFGYAHFATTETLLVTATLLVTIAFLRGLRSGMGAILLGVMFGLALNTKFNAVLLPIPLWLWAWWHHRERAANNIMAMTFLGPLVWFLTWPWIWTNTIPRVLDHLEHFLVHIQTNTWFHHQAWGWDSDPMPWYYPLEMILVTTPIFTVLLGVLGLYLCLRQRDEEHRGRLFALLLIVPLAVACAPGTPRYDGVRLLLPAVAFVPVILGVGLGHLRDLISAHRPAALGSPQRVFLANTAVIALVSIPGYIGIARAHPYELGFYNTFVGGIAGAEKRGYETIFWCEAINQPVVDHMNATLPPNALVRLGNVVSSQAMAHLQRFDVLRDDIRFVKGPQTPPDAALLQARQGMFHAREWFLWEQWSPEEFRAFGWPRWKDEPIVPMVIVTEMGPDENPAFDAFLHTQMTDAEVRAFRERSRLLDEVRRR